MLSQSNRVPRHRDKPDGERGSVALELALVFPVVMLMLFGMVQGGIYFYARNVAMAAAQEGARAAAGENGSSGAGQTAAVSFANRVGGGMVSNVSATASRGTSASVTVTCTTHSLVPGLDSFTVRQSASLPVERITA